jgi:soluble lytic murein transglycosylase-like protein
MPRARFQNQDDWQTAATYETGSGCLSFYLLPPFAVLVIAGFLTLLALNSPISTSALPMNNPSASNPISANQAETSSSGLSPIFTREIQHWGDDIVRWANAAGVDPNLAAVVMQIESCGDPQAVSRSGAMGLFQVMPFHFHRGENSYNPDTNALRGMDYLSRSLAAGGGNARLALAGYNGGIGVIARGEGTWAAETKRYVYYGAPIYEDARSGATSSPMLDEWYQKYGAGLCQQANRRLGISP